MTIEQLNQFNSTLSNHSSIHHINVTEQGTTEEYIIKNIEFDRPPKLLITKMYGNRNEQETYFILDYNKIERLEIIDHNNEILFEWTNE
ncbi:MAG TPA: hypothetical protein PLS49_03665 [Candidatus Woesebacteria bacterium]|nr:hypothetical protein [Candidatus Woesebacteria bacterium]